MLNDFLDRYTDSGISRFHMPGHKGNYPPLSDLLPRDITEIAGADTLYAPTGVLRELEEEAADFYGSRVTLLSAGGSTLCIHTMLAVARRYGRYRRVLAGRGAHVSFLYACALTGITPQWLLPTFTGVSGVITPETLSAALEQDDRYDAVYLTSPNYYGGVCDLSALVKICHAHRLPLFVDNAHGAHFKLCDAIHPMDAGADLCCDSLHKTLPVLTGGAMLHSRLSLTAKELTDCMALTGSTSPSYLILSSLAEGLRYQKEEGASEFAALAEQVNKLRDEALAAGFALLTGDAPADPVRLSLDTRPLGLTGDAAAALLRDHQMEPEYADPAGVVLLPSPQNRAIDFGRLSALFSVIEPQPPLTSDTPILTLPEQVLSPREALFAPAREIPIQEAAGQICAQMVPLCPPCIPLVVSGERLTPELCAAAEKAGIFSVSVVK